MSLDPSPDPSGHPLPSGEEIFFRSVLKFRISGQSFITLYSTMTEELKITLPLYEGPLDLLLDMIRKQKLDIYDIPIATVTKQYLEYLHLIQDMDVDVASEVLLIAAQLIYIKSRMLLPPDPDAVDAEAEDPRAELVRRLLEYEKFKNAAQMLYQREMIENAAWSNPGDVAMAGNDLEPELN